MKAAVYRRYGPPEVVGIEEVPTPAPGDREVLIQVRATTVNSGDARLRGMNVPAGMGLPARLMFGLFRPRKTILGSELAGEVVAVGRDVTAFQVGDPVFAFDDKAMGCHAEYKCLAEDRAIALKPAALNLEEAAALPFGGTTALHFLRAGRVQAGDRVLINGASGAVGVAMVQLARHMGAEVTGVCSAANAALVQSLGAHHVVDYTREDFTHNGVTYDVIADNAGTASYRRVRSSLKPGGRLLVVLGGLGDLLQAPLRSLTSGRKVVGGVATSSVEVLRELAALAEAGALKPVIDKRYPLEQIAEAHRHVDGGHKRGSVIITVGQPG